jgi:hypothetical protein
MRDCGLVFLAWVELVREGVEGEWVLAEVGYVEDGLGVREVEPCEIRVETGVWGAEVGYAG